jgi:hypothetical protein
MEDIISGTGVTNLFRVRGIYSMTRSTIWIWRLQDSIMEDVSFATTPAIHITILESPPSNVVIWTYSTDIKHIPPYIEGTNRNRLGCNLNRCPGYIITPYPYVTVCSFDFYTIVPAVRNIITIYVCIANWKTGETEVLRLSHAIVVIVIFIGIDFIVAYDIVACPFVSGFEHNGTRSHGMIRVSWYSPGWFLPAISIWPGVMKFIPLDDNPFNVW